MRSQARKEKLAISDKYAAIFRWEERIKKIKKGRKANAKAGTGEKSKKESL